MQENQRGAFAPDAQVKPFAVIGNESLHEKAVPPYSMVSVAAVKCRPVDWKSRCMAFGAKRDRSLSRLRVIRGRASMPGLDQEGVRSRPGLVRWKRLGMEIRVGFALDGLPEIAGKEFTSMHFGHEQNISVTGGLEAVERLPSGG